MNTKVKAYPTTPDEIRMICPNSEWDGGREGCLYARFDALLGRDWRKFRAEVTWDDNSEETGGAPTEYYNPTLLLETNRLSGDGLKRVDHTIVNLTKDEAINIVSSRPARLRVSYSLQLSRLKIPVPRTLILINREDGEEEQISECDGNFEASIARGAEHLGISFDEAMQRLEDGEELVGSFCIRKLA